MCDLYVNVFSFYSKTKRAMCAARVTQVLHVATRLGGEKAGKSVRAQKKLLKCHLFSSNIALNTEWINCQDR